MSSRSFAFALNFKKTKKVIDNFCHPSEQFQPTLHEDFLRAAGSIRFTHSISGGFLDEETLDSRRGRLLRMCGERIFPDN